MIIPVIGIGVLEAVSTLEDPVVQVSDFARFESRAGANVMYEVPRFQQGALSRHYRDLCTTTGQQADNTIKNK
jgi:hypothetical protein